MSTEHQNQSGTNLPTHQDVSFETRDVGLRPILKFLSYLGVGVIASFLMTVYLYRGLTKYWTDSYDVMPPSREGRQATMPPEPMMQGMPGHLSDPQQDLRDKVKADAAANNKFEWVDQANGIGQIPVKDAMKLIAEKGLPGIPVAEKK
jgi:hypothetical protein